MAWVLLFLGLPTALTVGFMVGAILGRTSGYEEGREDGAAAERHRIREAALARAGELTEDVRRILDNGHPATEAEGWDRG